MVRIGFALLALLTACAPVGRKPEDTAAGIPFDALLPSGRNLFAFDFTQARYRKLPLKESASDSSGLCRAVDSLRAGWPGKSGWLALPAPSRPFSPMQAAWGPSGNFFLLDRAGKRLGLYDSNAQFLSGIPLPAEIRERNLEAFQVFWTRDGTFSFLDLAEGKAWQYTELRAAGGGDWRLKNSVRLPVGLESCLWEPFFSSPCCLRPQGNGQCFDAYFNPIGPWPSAGVGAGMRPVAAAVPGEWMLLLDGGPACASPAVCLQPAKGQPSTCPGETEAAPSK